MCVTVCLRMCVCECKLQRGPREPNQAFRLGGPVNTAWRLAFVGSEDCQLSLSATWTGTLTVSAASARARMCVCVCVHLHLKCQKSHQLLSEAFGS